MSKFQLLALFLCSTALFGQQERTVRNGIDVLRAENFARLTGQKVGLITNHTGLALDGTSTAVLLHESENVDLQALFSPEHGFTGTAEGSVRDAVHEETGLAIYSLYGADRTPAPERLKGLDTLVFDIQDIGCRFYTYISTMGNAMQAAAQQEVRFIVLDRPNPIGGIEIGGPMRDEGTESFVSWHTMPVRHGMTVGEIARMFNAERDFSCDLQVVQMTGWQRGDYFDATGQTWVNPSPNMRSPTQALLYPGVGLLETTNLSVGRGTDTPFELLGAPWMDGQALAKAINESGIPGIRCVPIRFVPNASVFANQECSGIRFWITNRLAFDSIRLGMELACALRRLHKDEWDMERYNRLLVNREVLDMISSGRQPPEVMQVIARQLAPFYERRERYLLYR